MYTNTSYTTRVYGPHTYNELFHLIKDGKGIEDDENLDEREELTIAQFFLNPTYTMQHPNL